MITYTRCRTNRSKNPSYSSCLATKNPLSTGTNSNPTTLPSISCNSRSQAQLTPTLTSYAWTVRGTLMSSKSTSILYPIWRKSIIDFFIVLFPVRLIINYVFDQHPTTTFRHQILQRGEKLLQDTQRHLDCWPETDQEGLSGFGQEIPSRY